MCVFGRLEMSVRSPKIEHISASQSSRDHPFERFSGILYAAKRPFENLARTSVEYRLGNEVYAILPYSQIIIISGAVKVCMTL